MDALLDTAPCGFLSFTDDGTVQEANTTLAEMVGLSREEIVGSHVETLLSIPSRIFYQTHLFPLLRLEGHAEEIFLTLLSGAGERLAVIVNAARRERDGRPFNDCVIVRLRQRQKWEDEIMQAKRAAEEANRAKSSFLSMMSHDLRTPLNAIGGYADLISLGIRGPVTDEQVKDLNRIKEASGFLLSLLNDILSFARLDAGQLEIRAEQVSVPEALTRAEMLSAPQMAEAGLTYRGAECPQLIVRADAERVQQILLNLLTNAAKFTPPGGSVSTECQQAGDFAIVRVTDSGPGISPDNLEKIFEPFVQVDHGARDRKPGVGLGLAISRQLARAMGGDLTAASVVGEGSTFTLALPRGHPEADENP